MIAQAAGQVEFDPASISVNQTIELLWLWSWYEGCGLALLARLSASATLNCSLCGGERHVPARLFPPDISDTYYYCPQCSGQISGRRGVKFLDSPRRSAVVEPLLRGNEREAFFSLHFQAHQFEGTRTFKRNWFDKVHFDIHDYEQSQSRVSEAKSRFDEGDTDYARLLTRTNRKAKAQMNLPDDEALESAIDFEESIDNLQDRIPHLEIGPAILRCKDRIVTVSVPPPNKVTRPANKCPHGCWLQTGCKVCTPAEIPSDGKDWEDRVATAFSMVNSCDLCGRKMDNWRAHYCPNCAKNVIWTTIEISFSEKPIVEGRAAAYQEKKIRRGGRNSGESSAIPAVTFREVRIYAETILHSQLRERLGNPDLPPIITNRTCLWLLRNCDWLRMLFERFWLYLCGCTLQEIGESEDVQRNGVYDFIHRHSENIRALFDKLGGEDTSA